jgi:hypothetical protein
MSPVAPPQFIADIKQLPGAYQRVQPFDNGDSYTYQGFIYRFGRRDIGEDFPFNLCKGWWRDERDPRARPAEISEGCRPHPLHDLYKSRVWDYLTLAILGHLALLLGVSALQALMAGARFDGFTALAYYLVVMFVFTIHAIRVHVSRRSKS